MREVLYLRMGRTQHGAITLKIPRDPDTVCVRKVEFLQLNTSPLQILTIWFGNHFRLCATSYL